jgi:hypothetical protein
MFIGIDVASERCDVALGDDGAVRTCSYQDQERFLLLAGGVHIRMLDSARQHGQQVN